MKEEIVASLGKEKTDLYTEPMAIPAGTIDVRTFPLSSLEFRIEHAREKVEEPSHPSLKRLYLERLIGLIEKKIKRDYCI